VGALLRCFDFRRGGTWILASKWKTCWKAEPVLCLSLILAVVSSFAAGGVHLGAVDLRTLALLTCLMTVMSGLNRLGVFRLLALRLLGRVHNGRGLYLTLCLLCFFSAMIITNDVTLLTFVPFTLITLRLAGRMDSVILLVTLETVAANLGSMLTPIGNPQNLYLFSAYGMGAATFFATILPYGALSLLLLTLCAVLPRQAPMQVPAIETPDRPEVRLVGLYAALGLLSLLTVFRLLPWVAVLAVVVLCVLIWDRQTLRRVDYCLLLTFVFLFVFIGNLASISSVSSLLSGVVSGHEVLLGVLASQVLSNVPAAILLSGFTGHAEALMVGVNLGGLGTLIASMASLISFQQLRRDNAAPTGRYLLVFTAINVLFLLANLLLWLVLR
jgi:Na+/H+ antiporter NhaD/arsenite permease-like protein